MAIAGETGPEAASLSTGGAGSWPLAQAEESDNESIGQGVTFQRASHRWAARE